MGRRVGLEEKGGDGDTPSELFVKNLSELLGWFLAILFEHSEFIAFTPKVNLDFYK